MQRIFQNLQRRKWAKTLAIAALTLAPIGAQTTGSTFFGSMANFDVYNDTGQDAYGFDIELDGLTPQQVIGEFQSTRYGAPSIIPFTGGTHVRYVAQWNPQTQQFSASTSVPANFAPTLGHACVLTFVNGCDHYGIVTSAGATSTVMHWLVADPANPGSVIPFGGAAVSIPVPVVSSAPAVKNQPAGIAFDIQMPDRPGVQFGEPRWVKVFKSELPREVALDELLGGNPVVPEDPAQVETSTKLLQKNPHSVNSGTLHSQGSPNTTSHSIVRRYEFYKYTGKRDPLTGEALCIDPTCNTADPSEIGDYIGDQMAAVNIGGVPSVTVAVAGNGNVTGTNAKISCGTSCTAIVAAGTSVTLTAKPSSGSVFSGWGGACNGLQLSCTVVVNDALNVTATFTPVHTLSVGHGGSGTVTANPASVDNTQISCPGTCSAKFAEGTVVNLTATPAGGAAFTGWTGACSGTQLSCAVTISKDTQVQANFK